MYSKIQNDVSCAWPALVAGGLLSMMASGARAQQPIEAVVDASGRAVAELAGSRSILAGSHGVARKGGQVLGGGNEFRAEFEPGTFTFTPALGRQAATSMPISFTLEEVRLGDRIVLDADTGVRPGIEGDLVVYRRGAGIDERYEVRPDGVHQTFLFDSLPAGGGDLVVRGRIDTMLMASPARAGAGASFELAGVGGVSWGEVTGIDADGDAIAGDLRLDGDVLELVLPGEFVAEASFPLLLDPLVGTTFDIDASFQDDGDPEVAFDVTNNVYLVVFERAFSFSDVDVRAQRVSATGSLIGSTLFLSSGVTTLASNPSVASINLGDRFLVAWQQASSLFNPFQIVAMSVDASDGTLSGLTTVGPSANQQRDCSVGGDRTEDDNEALVVWEEDGVGIRMAQVSVTTFSAPITALSSPFTLEAETATHIKANPTISRSGGDAGFLLVAWEQIDAAGLSTLQAQVVNRYGGQFGTEVDVSSPMATTDDRFPSCDGDGERWVLAWQSEEEAFPGSFDIHVRGLSFDGSQIVFETDVVELEADPNDNEMLPSVAWTGASALVGYIDDEIGQGDVYAKAVDPFTCEVCEPEMQIQSITGGDSSSVAVGADYAGGDGFNNDDALIVFQTVLSGRSDSDLQAVRYDANSTPVDLGGECGQGGTNFNPCAVEGNAEFRAQLDGALPGAPTFFMFSFGWSPIACGPCTLQPAFNGSEQVFATATDFEGDASVHLPIPMGASGATIFTQWATLIPGGACPVLAGFELSNGLETTVAP